MKIVVLINAKEVDGLVQKENFVRSVSLLFSSQILLAFGSQENRSERREEVFSRIVRDYM